MKNLYKIQDELYVIDNNEKVTQNGVWALCSFTGDILKNRNGQYAYKVILTTDKLLIKDGVQAIDDEFLEWFVNNPSCESVRVEIDYFKWRKGTQKLDDVFKIIIPKEEPKQETLEEAAEKFAKKFGSEIDSTRYYAFINGAKWQAERMYSEEDLKKIIYLTWLKCLDANEGDFIDNRNEILEQFKNK